MPDQLSSTCVYSPTQLGLLSVNHPIVFHVGSYAYCSVDITRHAMKITISFALWYVKLKLLHSKGGKAHRKVSIFIRAAAGTKTLA